MTEKENRVTDIHNMNSASRIKLFTGNYKQGEVSQKRTEQSKH